MKGKKFVDATGMKWQILENKNPDKVILENEKYSEIREEFLKSTVRAAIQSGILKETEVDHDK